MFTIIATLCVIGLPCETAPRTSGRWDTLAACEEAAPPIMEQDRINILLLLAGNGIDPATATITFKCGPVDKDA